MRASEEDEDELDAFMANLEKDGQISHGNASKKVKIDLIDPNDSGPEELDPIDDGTIENIEADVKAAIAGKTGTVNKTIKKLYDLGKKDVEYLPFRKNFYVEVPELSRLTDEDVKQIRESMEDIKVIGQACPKPITCWAQCGLTRKMMDILKKSQYSNPTPIQAQAIPAIMSGHDVLGIAKTGCGKTLSYLLPMFRHILDQPKLKRGDGPIAVVIIPTRELATQICNDALKFTKSLGLRIVAVYGGPNISEQIGMLKQGAEIVICAPGRMIEILGVNGGRVTNLNRCTFLVLDEADRLFDMGFEKQIKIITDLIRPDRQTVMLSATFPKNMEAHARKFLRKPIEIQVGGRSVVCKDVKQYVEIIDQDDKFLRLLEILQQHISESTSAIVFVSKQEKADSLLDDLMQAYDPNCLVLHGGIDKDDRISTFASFKAGQAKVLVATSVAARGLDVKNCICVVNYDCPNHYEDYVHRCGRTGRAGNKGFAYTFITPEQGNHAADIIKAFQLSENPVPVELQKLWDNYKEEAERLGKKIWSSYGFSGKGFKFDEAEAQLVNEKKKYQKKSLGLQNSDDEEEGFSDSEVDLTKLTPKKTEPTPPGTEENMSKIELAKQRAAMILSQKGGTSPTTSSSNVQTSPSPSVPPPAKERKLEMKMEINDYLQQVRRRLTSKEALARISESCEVGITVRGQYCQPGDRPLEPKLYLAIEGSSDDNLQAAHKELLLLVKDEYNRINSKNRYRLL